MASVKQLLTKLPFKDKMLPRQEDYQAALPACSRDVYSNSGGYQQMSEREVINNQKRILKNQKAILSNQGQIKVNQGTIKKNQASILKNQTSLNSIIKNQEEILALLKK
jgi:hypothetical protein